MKEQKHKPLYFILQSAICILTFLFFCGCGGPNPANIKLRKENQQLTDQIKQLNHRHDADAATIQSLQGKTANPPELSQDKLEKLFTCHGLALGSLSGGYDRTGGDSGDGLNVYAVPTDEQDQPIKSAGSFKVEAFDLDAPDKPLIGTWTFDPNQSRDLFYAHLGLYTYVLTCPWQTRPVHTNLTVKVTYDDLLTGRQFAAQQQVKVHRLDSPQ